MANLLKFHNSREYADSMKPLNDKRFANSSFKTGPLHSKEFRISHQSDDLCCMELSHDETFFVIGGRYEGQENVLKLSMLGDIFGTTRTELNPTVIHFSQYITEEQGINNCILSLAISPDDRRIISSGISGSSGKILVHDIQRSQLLLCITQPGDCGRGISVQPSSPKGDVFAVGYVVDDILRVFDIRCSTSVPVIEKAGQLGGIISVAFSPVDSTHVAIGGGSKGGKTIDIRQPNQDLLLLSPSDRCDGIRYSSKGDRILFMKNTAGPQVIEIASFNSGGEDEGKKQLSSGIGNDSWTVNGVCRFAGASRTVNGACCFAGANDDMIVAASRQGDLHVWSIPEGRFDSSTNNEQIMHLTFNDDGNGIKAVFYSKHSSALVSCSEQNHIKVWNPFKLPTENGM